DSFGQTVAGQLFPRVASIVRHAQTAARSAALQIPRKAPRLPESGEDDRWCPRIDGDVGCAGVLVFLQHLLPGLAAVARAINAALRVRSERVSEHRGKRDVGVRRV